MTALELNLNLLQPYLPTLTGNEHKGGCNVIIIGVMYNHVNPRHQGIPSVAHLVIMAERGNLPPFLRNSPNPPKTMRSNRFRKYL